MLRSITSALVADLYRHAAALADAGARVILVHDGDLEVVYLKDRNLHRPHRGRPGSEQDLGVARDTSKPNASRCAIASRQLPKVRRRSSVGGGTFGGQSHRFS
jgi:hypothetical protein